VVSWLDEFTEPEVLKGSFVVAHPPSVSTPTTPSATPNLCIVFMTKLLNDLKSEAGELQAGYVIAASNQSGDYRPLN
jgi:hypothetical protein